MDFSTIMQIFAIVLVVLFVTIALFYCCLHCLSCDKYFTSKPRSSPDVEAAVRRVPATRSSEGAAQQNVDRSHLTSQGDHHHSYQFKHQVVQPPNVGKSTSILVPHYQVQPKPPPQFQPKEIHPQLNEAVKFKHIAPNCRSVQDAEQKSLERDSKYPQDVGEINTVFQVSPEDFIIETNATYGRVLKSREKVKNWSCKKISDTQYEGRPESKMHAVFHLPEEGCHYSPGESRKTRAPRNSSRNRGNMRGRSASRGRSRSRIRK